MSMIDDVMNKKIPTGRKFQAKVGAGNVEKKVYAATRGGALKNLADNQDLINNIAQKRQADIRAGKYTRDKRIADYREALKDKTLTKDDKADLKAMLEHWSKGEPVKSSDSKSSSASVKTSKGSARAAAKKAQFKPSPRRELPDFLKNRGSVSVSSKSSPWAAPGSGGGIASGLGGGSASANPASRGGGYRPPSLLR